MGIHRLCTGYPYRFHMVIHRFIHRAFSRRYTAMRVSNLLRKVEK